MKVKELIEELKLVDPEAEIWHDIEYQEVKVIGFRVSVVHEGRIVLE